MSERSRRRILERIRSAVALGGPSYPEAEVRQSRDRRLSGADRESLLNLFRARQEELGGRVFVERQPERLLEQLAERVRRAGQGPVWVEEGLCVGGKAVAEALREFGVDEVHVATAPEPGVHWKELLADAAVGITGADWLLAQTGSVVLIHSRQRPRSLSLLPAAHFVVASAEILLPDLDAVIPALCQRFGEKDFSAATIITGSSRTADIEKILVRGVHGPQNLEVFLLA
ncbi:MAG: lactate utilization protein [candidate division KSB1 bacterium]|nr:lactate utilization protein [candidate division KSB1 bacterium]